MTDFSQNSVADLRTILVDSGKYTNEEAESIKGKSKLIEHVLKLDNGNDYTDVLANAELDGLSNNVDSDNQTDTKPNPTNPDWNEYVISHFQSDELVDDKYPNLVGLRRVAEKLVGTIVSSGPETVFPANEHNHSRATCVYSIEFDHALYGRRYFSASADCWEGNSDTAPFNKFPTCIAENRAEARALRRALRLKVVAAEEMSKDDLKIIGSSSGEWKETDPISEQQILSIKKKCKDLKIDLNKFINSGDNKYDDITKVTRGIGTKMMQRLNEYQSVTPDSVEIPYEMKVSDK